MNLTEAQALVAIAINKDADAGARLAAFNEADDARKSLKMGWSKLGLTIEQVTELKETLPGLATISASEAIIDGDTGAITTDDQGALGDVPADNPSPEATKEPETSILPEETAPEQTTENVINTDTIAKADAKVQKAKEAGAGETRGGLTRLVESLLMDPALTYLDIINAVLREFPKANTSARSIASVAAGMRRKHVEVPMRRPAKVEKPAAPVEMIPVTTEETVTELEAEQAAHEAHTEG